MKNGVLQYLETIKFSKKGNYSSPFVMNSHGHKMKNYTIGIDVGGTNIRIGAGENGGPLENFVRVPCNSVFTGENSMDTLAAFIEGNDGESAPRSNATI